jgi:hypothetical protein
VLGIGADAATTGMAEHDDVADAEHPHREFERREDAEAHAVRCEPRHQIGDVAHDEQFARMGIEDPPRHRDRAQCADANPFFRALPDFDFARGWCGGSTVVASVSAPWGRSWCSAGNAATKRSKAPTRGPIICRRRRPGEAGERPPAPRPNAAGLYWATDGGGVYAHGAKATGPRPFAACLEACRNGAGLRLRPPRPPHNTHCQGVTKQRKNGCGKFRQDAQQLTF